MKPPKSEAKKKLSNSDLVSFVPMRDLGTFTKKIQLNEDRPLGEVAGGYTYFADDDVLLAKITPCFENGKLGIARNLTNGVGFGSSEYIIFRCNGAIDSEYLFYFLSQNSFRNAGARVMTGAVGHKRVPKEFVENYPVPLPPLPEQKRIVAILDESFAGIAQAVAHTEKNLANARELFESYLNSVFTRKGEGWVETTVGSLVDQQILDKPLDGNHGEIHPKKADFVDSGVPFIMASDLVDGVVDQSDCNFITREQGDSLRKGFAKEGDVLLSHKGTIGRAAVLNTSHHYVMLTPQVTYYRIVDRKALHNRYLYYYFQCPRFQAEISHIASAGSTRAYIGITKQLHLIIFYPPIGLQLDLASTFDALVNETERLKSLYQKKLTALAELKQSILQKAFAGQLTKNMEGNGLWRINSE